MPPFEIICATAGKKRKHTQFILPAGINIANAGEAFILPSGMISSKALTCILQCRALFLTKDHMSKFKPAKFHACYLTLRDKCRHTRTEEQNEGLLMRPRCINRACLNRRMAQDDKQKMHMHLHNQTVHVLSSLLLSELVIPQLCC